MIKILGFQMRVLVTLTKEYNGYLGNSISAIYQLVMQIKRQDYIIQTCLIFCVVFENVCLSHLSFILSLVSSLSVAVCLCLFL